MSWIGKALGTPLGAALGVGVGLMIGGPGGAAFVATLAVSGAGLGLSAGSSVDQKRDADQMNQKMEARNETAMAKQERKAEVMAKKDFNRKAQAYAAGTVAAQKDLLDEKRKRVADNRNYGNPVA
ncbi:MAG: hypothetical protein Q8P84_00750 [Deltaproteobacteria bacterium]|nr:hypothetical protein [Deltaproteobacteria bacterium]